MSDRARFGSKGIVALLFPGLAAACSSPQPPPADAPAASASAPEPAPTAAAAPQEIPWEPVESGKDCTKAEAQCGGGVCLLSYDNQCAEPVTCNVFIVSVCQVQTSIMQVKGRTRETVPAQKKTKFSLPASCTEGQNVSTKVEKLECK